VIENNPLQVIPLPIGLKVEVSTLGGLRHGVPALLDLFAEYKVQATFLFALGPDRPLRLAMRQLHPARLARARQNGLLSQIRFRDLAGGLSLSGGLATRGAADLMRRAADLGHEVGVLGWDTAGWLSRAARADRYWTGEQLEQALDAFERIMGRLPEVHGTPGWQVNPHLLALEESMGFLYACDTRGLVPYRPELSGVVSQCVQLPTTLPTLDELIGREGVTEENAHEHLFFASQRILVSGHVLTLRAEYEGRRWLGLMEKLIVIWKGSQRDLVPLKDLVARLDWDRLPRHRIGWAQVDGRAGYVAMQGERL